jgi:hypothetical protein
MFKLRVVSLAVLISVGQISLVTPSQAAPWAEVGDLRLRSDLELLADYGLFSGPINSWPLPWAQISDGLNAQGLDLDSLPPHVLAALQRVEILMPGNDAFRSTRYEAGANFGNRPTLVRDFGDGTRADAEGYVRLEKHFTSSYVSINVGARTAQSGEGLNFERTYVAQVIGNWVGYLGWVENWWGPGWDSTLLFSNNARPFPKIGLKRLNPKPFESKWLSWIGPWQFEAFVGLLDEQRDFSNQVVAGIKLAIEPIDGLNIGFNRALQLCGNGRPCGLKTWANSFIGIGNADNTGTFDEPGNQIAGVDIRYGNHIGNVTYSLYGELIGEDEDNIIIDQISILSGASLNFPISGDGTQLRLTGEYSDTFANRSFPGRERGSSTYNNFIYRDGFTYRGRAIGHSLDGDSRLVSFTGSVVDRRNRVFRASFRHADVNGDSRGRHSISANREKINLVELETEWPTEWGDLRAQVSVADDQANTPDRSKATASFEFGWRVRF